MGNAAAMKIAKDVAAKASDVLITNADEYDALYDQAPFDKKENLQKFNGAYNALGSIAMTYSKTGTHEASPSYWVQLGHWAAQRKKLTLLGQAATLADEIKKQQQAGFDKNKPTATTVVKEKHIGLLRYGKCFICAGLAVYKLLKNPEFVKLNLNVEVCKTAGVKHYFVVVGRTDPKPETINDVKSWGANAFVIDLWQANLNQDYPLWGRLTDDAFKNPAVTEPKDWQYIKDTDTKKVTVACLLKPPFTDEIKKIKELKGEDD